MSRFYATFLIAIIANVTDSCLMLFFLAYLVEYRRIKYSKNKQSNESITQIIVATYDPKILTKNKKSIKSNKCNCLIIIQCNI